MPTHAVLVTWQNMEPKVLPNFISKATAKYGANFHRIYFDGSTTTNLRNWVRGIPGDERIKLFISGHGGVGIDYITDDTQTVKKNVDELVDLVSDGLQGRNTSKATSQLCQVNMISCLFGRTPDGRANTSPAAKLHDGLTDWDVFVDLVARTESIIATPDGRRTNSQLSHRAYEPVYGRLERFFLPKVPYTKVLFTFNGDARVMRFAAYDPGDNYIEATTLDGRRILWADYSVDQIVQTIQLKGTGLLGTGPKDVTDEREKKLRDIITWYDTMRNPTRLKEKLEELVDGSGDDESSNFLKHRNLVSAAFSSSTPAKAKLIQDLLAAYPT
ncbi:hypothetical protein [Dyella choica]|uniref:Uncharacterized protein n=1 Tax=Dyella choica TaxID=1927959 RepID=A0A3S0PJ72_9GAMM|nr:hypothetical protein [Dyella choica]RUL76685.1 hypothetical protein EKH80_08140 [Dyella choica]